LKQVQIIPVTQHAGETSYDELKHNIQEKLNKVLDDLWSMIDEEKATKLHEVCLKIREIFNDMFRILTQQQNQIDYLNKQVQDLQVTRDELLLSTLATQLVIKMSRFVNINEHPSIAACRTISMIMAQANVHQLKMFLDENGYNLEEICLAVQVLKRNRNCAAHPNDPSTSFTDIQNAINHLFPATSHPKRILAEKALKLLEVLSKELKEPLFLKTD